MSDTAETPPPDLAHADIGIVCALPMELRPFLDRCARVSNYTGGNFTFRGGRYDDIKVAIVESGMGFARARRATQALIDAHTPHWVLASGFCGALQPGVNIGDIVMADSIVDLHGHELKVDIGMRPDPKRGLHVGRIVTSDELVRTVAEKQELGETYQAVAVDMESLAVAQICRETKTRFVCVRAISDDLSEDLPPEVLAIMGSTGSTRLGAAVGAMWKRFGSVKDIWRLRENAAQAADRLATFLDGVVTQLYEAKH